MGFALGFLLIGLAFGLLALGFGERFLVFLLALIFGGAGLVQRDRDRLLAVLHFTGLAFRATLQLAMREFMHDSTDDFLLLWRFLGHGWTHSPDKTCNTPDLFRDVGPSLRGAKRRGNRGPHDGGPWVASLRSQ